jgi:hypothetical protein
LDAIQIAVRFCQLDAYRLAADVVDGSVVEPEASRLRPTVAGTWAASVTIAATTARGTRRLTMRVLRRGERGRGRGIMGDS